MTSPAWLCTGWTIRKPSRHVSRLMVQLRPISFRTAQITFKRQFPDLKNHIVVPAK